MSVAKPVEDRIGNAYTPAKVEKGNNLAWVTPDPPDDVKSVELWESVWALGGPSGVYHAVADYQIVKRYVQMCDRREELLKRLDEEGWTEIGSQGQTVQHPAARILSDVEGKLVPLEDRLGLSPQARHTVQVGHIHAVTALEEWLDD